jgi:hypothetical protein
MVTEYSANKYNTGKCKVHGYHYPSPIRTVVHHIFPQEWGGKTIAENLVTVCDTGHYNIHAILADLVVHQGVQVDTKGTRTERALAFQGYRQWVVNGKPALDEVEYEAQYHGIAGMGHA